MTRTVIAPSCGYFVNRACGVPEVCLARELEG